MVFIMNAFPQVGQCSDQAVCDPSGSRAEEDRDTDKCAAHPKWQLRHWSSCGGLSRWAWLISPAQWHNLTLITHLHAWQKRLKASEMCVLMRWNTQDNVPVLYNDSIIVWNEADSLRLGFSDAFYFFSCLPDSPILLGTVSKSQLRECLQEHRNEVIEPVMCWVITEIVLKVTE